MTQFTKRSIDDTDVIMSYTVATAAERLSGTLIPANEIRRRLVDIRAKRLAATPTLNDVASLQAYMDQIKSKLVASHRTAEIPMNLRTQTPLPFTRQMPLSTNTGGITTLHSDQARRQIDGSTLHGDQTPRTRPNALASGDSELIVNYLRTLSPGRQQIELKRLKRQALDGVSWRTLIAQRRMHPISSISGTLPKRMPRHRPDVQRISRERISRGRPVLGRPHKPPSTRSTRSNTRDLN